MHRCLQPDKACFRHFSHICELQLPEFTSTAMAVSRVDCLGNFTIRHPHTNAAAGHKEIILIAVHVCIVIVCVGVVCVPNCAIIHNT